MIKVGNTNALKGFVKNDLYIIYTEYIIYRVHKYIHTNKHTHTHKHTQKHTHIYIYIYYNTFNILLYITYNGTFLLHCYHELTD